MITKAIQLPYATTLSNAMLSLYNKSSTSNKPWVANVQGYGFDMQSAVNASVYSESTKILEDKISKLIHPLSPASFSAVSNTGAIKERLFDATATVKIMTSQVAMYLNAELRNKLFKQIDSLHDIDEWDADDKPIQQMSFATFLKAILQIRPQRLPGLGLTYEGFLIGAWTTDKNRLTIEFLPSNNVRWVLSRYQDGESERAAGFTSVSLLLSRLAPYHPEEWFSYE